MFKTKLEVDRHVDNCLKKINNETERNLRCISFAKLYFNVGDYEQTCRYVSSYLSVKPKSPEGHHLLGKALEKLGKKGPALDAYRTSLQLDSKQNNLVIKVCELLASDDVDMDKSDAKYYCELAQSFDPHNPAVFSLKERLITTDNENPQAVSQLLLKELENRPTDVNLRVKLLKHFLQNNMIKEAYKHASDIEEKNLSIFHKNLNWYETFAEVLLRFQRDATFLHQLNWEFWFLSVSVLDRLVMLSLDDHLDNIKNCTEYVSAVFNLDQMLNKAAQSINDCPDRQLVLVFLNHYHAQLYFHLSTLILKQAKKDLMHFKEACNISLPVLFAAYHSSPPDIQSVWLSNIIENRRRTVLRWHKEACFRCSQTGHVLVAAAKERKSIVIEKASQYSTGMWREQLFKKIFVKRDQQQKMSTSYFLTNSNLEPIIKLPEPSDLLKYDEVAQLVYPDSLHHHIWIALNSNLPDLSLTPFEGLQYSIKNLNNCAAETLNLLDLQSFIYCATLCAQLKQDDNRHLIYYNQDKPNVLPAAISEELGTLNQSKFIAAAYKMYKNEYGSNMGELRLMLIKGIEVVRCVGHHGLDVKLLVTLANIFANRSKNLTKQSEIEFTDARAELYWKTALPLLEKLKNNQIVTYAPNRLFEYKSKDLSITEITSYIEKGKLFTGTQLMRKKEFEKALHIFEALKDPYASFYQSQIYKHMADHKTNQNKENVTSEMRSQNIILLSRARDCLYLTLDRLRAPTVDRAHPLNTQLGGEIEKMERLLSRIDPDCTNRNECDGMSDENVSSDSAGEHYLTSYTTHHTSFPNGKHDAHQHSTPYRFDVSRREARPSPERLDAQIRQLTISKDIALQSILEQNKAMMESHRNLVDELRSFKDAVNNLTSTVEELKDVKKSVVELKDDLQNVVDVVQEMKKEIGDLKKDTHKNNQLSDEDLYVLDPDYGVDYNINSNMAAYNSNLYPSYQGPRISNPAAQTYPHPGLYPGLYPGAMAAYAYGGLGMPQPGGLSFVPDQQLPSIAAAVAAAAVSSSLTQQTPPFVQPPATIGIPPPTSLGLGLLNSQNISQALAQAQANLIKDSPKATLSTFTSTTQSVFPSMTTISSSASQTTNHTPPINVVITASDPLPPTNTTPISQPILSVTIPPQHLKGNVKSQQPHSYQIAIPSPTITTTPLFLSKQAPAICTQSILSNVAPPLFSAIPQTKTTPQKDVRLGLQIEKTLEETFKSPNISGSEEYDPCPDFKPIIPLPDEVPTNTGEELETVLFNERARLYRYIGKEWKERGIGNLKILLNSENGKIRILMRRDQIFKICANHFLTTEMVLKAKSDRAYIWAANDFADETVVLETFCVRFKTPEEAKKFHDAFEDAKMRLKGKSSLGGFVFTSTPSFKPKEAVTVVSVTSEESTKSSPFSSFTFATSKQPASIIFKPISVDNSFQSPKITELDDSAAEEFVPTAEFKPVIALPDLVEVKTGEENAEVLFESRAKLFRLDTSGDKSEWKERGIGIMKVLKEDTIRLLMRREQVHKVCCNHQIIKDMTFKAKQTNPRAIIWSAQDFSEGVLTPETFTVLFKTEDQANQFLKIVQSAQSNLNESNNVSSKHQKPDTSPKHFGDKFKPAKGSWECKNCYIVNDGKKNHCVACETPKNLTVGGKPDESCLSGSAFSFGIPTSNTTTTSSGMWGNSFVKPAETNDNTPKSSFGDQFKPKEGSWECKVCYIRNNAETQHCVSCENPKDDSIPKKDSGKEGISLETPGLKFNFGFPPQETENKKSFAFGDSQFSFGSKIEQKSSGGFSFGTSTTGFSFGTPTTTTNTTATIKEDTEKFVFGSPKKHEFEFTPRSPRRISSGQGDEESDGSYVEEEVDNIYFKPVIPLPDKIDVKTGEEEEDVLYSHRAKLFRFVSGEWKERGLGDIKILKRKGNGKLRVVMRREQVLKICLNHTLTKDIEYLPKDDKTWLFHAPDFSEGEINREQFCLRFKNGDIAQEFKKAVTDALASNSAGDKAGDVSVSSSKDEASNDDDEVEIVYETKVSKEDEKEAVRLGLPPKFLSYKQLPDCECEQCKKDDEYLKELFGKKEQSPVGSIFGTPYSMASTPSTGDSLFSTPKTSFNFTPTTVQNDTLKDLLRKPKINFVPASSDNTKQDSVIKNFSFNPPTNTTFASNVTTPNLFGNTSSTNVFGTPSGGSIFGGTIFGGGNSSSSSIFDNSGKKPATFLSGGSLFDSPASTTGKSIFGEPLFGSGAAITTTAATTITPIFGASTLEKPVKESKPDDKKEKVNSTLELKEDDEAVLTCNSGLSFASLAANTSTALPVFQTKTTPSDPFSFLGAGAPVFGDKKKERERKAEEEDGEEQHGDEEYDPHYDPIVPLPAAIVVSTGEENETALFNERAKLYRYDTNTKEWKERGVGQMKLLHHPQNKTYRLLLRREQVHKVVLNQLITSDLDLQPMKTSDTAWMWAGYNYTDNESNLEKLAVRFKNVDLAKRFYDCVQDTIRKTQTREEEQPEPQEGLEDISDDPDSDEDDDDDDRTIMFTKRCGLKEQLPNGEWSDVVLEGDLQVYYDPEYYAARISINDDTGEVLSSTLIGSNTIMEIDKNECTWKAVEWIDTNNMRWRNLKAIFDSEEAAEDFHSNYLEGLNYALELGITDEIPVEVEGEE